MRWVGPFIELTSAEGEEPRPILVQVRLITHIISNYDDEGTIVLYGGNCTIVTESYQDIIAFIEKTT